MKKFASLNDTNVVYYYKIVDSENNINDHLRKYLEVQTLYPTERTVKVRREDIPRYMLNGAAGKLTRDEYDRLMSGNHVDVKDYLVKNDKDEFECALLLPLMHVMLESIAPWHKLNL